jgi:hypothetical protein
MGILNSIQGKVKRMNKMVMKDAKLSIKGPGLEKIPKLLKNEFAPSKIHDSGKTVVLVDQNFDFTTGDPITSVIIIDYKENERCDVEVLVGGAKEVGIVITDFGAEGNLMKNIKLFFRDTCESNGWKLSGDIYKEDEDIPRYRRWREERMRDAK